MDMAGATTPFLHGEAHAGIAIGVKNLVARALPQVVELLIKNPGYSLLLVGYSLG